MGASAREQAGEHVYAHVHAADAGASADVDTHADARTHAAAGSDGQEGEQRPDETHETTRGQAVKSAKDVSEELSSTDGVLSGQALATNGGAPSPGNAAELDEAWLAALLERHTDVEHVCMSWHISVEDFKSLAREVLAQWRFTDTTHSNDADKRRHLVNTINLKLQNRKALRNDSTDIYCNGASGYQSRRSALAEQIMQQLAHYDQDEPDISGNY